MKRTKGWWRKFLKWERSFIITYERATKNGFYESGGPYLPDDCHVCRYCGTPGCGCLKEYYGLIYKGEQR